MASLVESGPETGDFPLSPGQKALWFLDRLAPGNAAYVLAAAARVKKGLEPAELLGAVEALVARHPALRTTFGEGPDGPYQRVHERLAPEVIVQTDTDGQGQDADVHEIAWRPFDLERGPLLRVALLGDTLVISVHHIVCDFWSAEVMAQDLGLLLSGADAESLPALPLRFTDCVFQAAERLAGPEGERLWSFWSRQLGGELPRMELPTDRPRPHVRTWAGGAVSARVAPELLHRLHALSKGARTTFFTTLTAAFQALLGRYARQEDVLIGSPTAGRTHRTTAGLVGYFVNPVVLRGDLSGDPTFAELLARTKTMVLAALEHRAFPFPVLAERLVPERDPSRQAVFDVMFAFQRERSAGSSGVGGFALGEGGDAMALGAFEMETLNLEPPATDFDLSLMGAEIGGSLVFSLRYSAELFDRATAERLLAHFGRFLEGIAGAPESRLSELPLLDAVEREEVLATLNPTERPRPRGVLLHGPFFAQADRTPGAEALIDGGVRWTYGELAARAESLAARLLAAGVGPETPVGVCLERTPELIASLLAVLRAGGLYVPLDPKYPKDRLAAILEDAGAPVLMTEERCLGVLPETGAQVVRVDEEVGAALMALEAAPPDEAQVAYLIYTSGSTGRPKGVAIPHRSAAEMVAWAREVFPPADLAGMLASTSICFDLSVFEIFVPLSAGGRLILADNALELPELPACDEVTLINTVPSAMAELVRARAVPASVRTVNLAGEPLRGALARRVLELPGVRLFNLYGPSEDTTYSTFTEVRAEGEPTIGVAISNTRVYLVDPQLHLTPRGVPGELCLSGEGLARGYFGRPELTAERFVPDPFAVRPGERMYRTGDLARWRPDGQLDFLGRIDFQVKIRGFRIEPGEIEALLLAHPEVREALVLPRDLSRETTPGDLRLVAFVALKREEALAGLRPYLRERLPEHMVPWAIVPLPALPLSPNGKVDRKALGRIEVAREPSGAADAVQAEAPRTPDEELLARLWCEVLGLSQVGIHDNFFHLGGHSLLATQLVSRLREALGVELPLRQVFETPTVAGLARLLPGLGSPRAVFAEEAAGKGNAAGTGEGALSFAQERLWFLDRFEPGSAAYNMPAALRITGALDAGALAAAFGEIVRRHEVLRTGFPESGGRPVRRVQEWREWTLPLADLAAPPAAEREAASTCRVRQEAARPFDLARPPLLRTLLLRLSPEEHVLVVVLHHAVADGWSIAVLLRELTALYGAYTEGQASPLPELPGQYADFAARQREWLRGPVLEEQLAYWRQALAGAPETLDLPADLRRPHEQSYRGAQLAVTLPSGLAADLGALAQGLGATPFMVLMAGFQTLLSRLSGQRDIVVGSPIANRTRLEIEPLIGCFVNTLALRLDLSADPTFSELASQAREVTLGAYAHQDLPFERLVEALLPVRDPGRTPICQSLFVLQNTPAGALELPGLKLALLAVDIGIAKFDLSLLMEETADGVLAAALEYSTDLFDATTVRRWATHLETLLLGIAAEPWRRVSELPLLGGRERAQLLTEWNDAAVLWPEADGLHELVERQAARAPEAVAVTFEGRSLTYAGLDDLADRWAGVLRGLGVGPETLVGVCLERSVEMVVALLSVLKAGGAYVPIDPSYPEERIAYMLGDSRVPVLLTQERLLAVLPLPETGGPRTLCLDTSELPAAPGRPDSGATSGTKSGTGGQSAAYAIYTSGSTGRPKGAVNTHEGIVNRLLWMQRQYGLGPADRVLQKTPFSFDVSVWEFFWPLSTGARLVMARPGGHQDPDYLVRLIRGEGITTLHFVPSMLQVFLEEPGVAECSSLRRVMASGEALPVKLAERFFERMPAGVELHNLYGPTEAAVDVTYEPCAPDRGASSVPIGRPVANTRIHLLDPAMRPVPVGVAGELHIGGVQLARGYLRRPELTAERFVPDPCGDEPGARLYKTGDLARHLPDGRVDFLGRLDFQVKIRGFRIELGEIEAALAGHPEVHEAVVLARTWRSTNDTRLVAYLVAGEGATPAELHRHLSAKLPSYMVPSAFVRLERLPVTDNGKLDRRALPEPDEALASRTDLNGDYVAPRNPAEEALAGLWSGLLGVERVGIHDSFFALGGHSLLATQLVSRIRGALGVELPLRRFFEVPTIAGISASLRDLRAVRPEEPSGAPRDKPAERPLSFAQERLWFLDRLEPGAALYNIPAAVRFRGDLDPAALAAAFGEVVRRHEVLRSALVESAAGRPVQKAAPWSPWELPLTDLSSVSGPSSWRQLAEAEARRPFDLSAGSLLRTLLIRLGAREHVLVLVFHHAAADGWSLGVFLRELVALYGAALAGAPSPLPAPALQYADFAEWQREWLAGPVLKEQLGYWRRTLADAPEALDLPADHPRPALPSHRGRQHRLALSPGLSAAVGALARRLGGTPFMVLLAAFETLLGRLTGQEDVIAGSPVANRNRLETEGLIGFFVNTLALRLDLAGDPPFEELVRRAREVTLAAYDHQDLPFEKLVQELVTVRDASRPPVFQVLFALQDAPLRSLTLTGLEIDTLPVDTGTAKFDLSLLLEEGEGGYQGFLEYATDLFESATVERLAGHFQTLLAASVAGPRTRVQDLLLMTVTEREQVLSGFNQTALEHPGEPLLHELILAQVERTPEAVALVWGRERLTYRQIAERSAHMAARLQAAGVGPEVPVGVCLERTPLLLVSLLGVMRAGGFYVPLDPNYPKERLAAILEDSAAPVLVTEESCLGVLPETGARIVRADRSEEDAAAISMAALPVDALAYTIYTSGSTGRPKGVAISHRNVVALAYWAREVYSVEELAGVLGSTSVCFDMSVFELFVTLAWGGTVILAENALELPDLPARDQVTLINTVPSAMAELVRLRAVPPSVRTVNLGGEALRGALARHIHELGQDSGPIRLYNVYGPSEDTTFTTWADVGPAGEPTIGRPLANTRIYVLDRNLRPVPVGVPGEVYISGAGVTRGYLGKPGLTAEKYLPDPFRDGGTRMYRVGDLGRWRADGELEYLGRIDHQVKIRGFRVELGDVEAALLSHPGVREAVVVTREPLPGDVRLAAFVVAKAGALPGDLRAWLKERLPDYMVPWAVTPLDKLPLLPNGKVNRRALPEPADARREGAGEGVAPRTPAEEALAILWAEVLGLGAETVSVHDDFFDLGGHSLLATQLLSRVREALGVELPLRQFFDAPTIAGMAPAFQHLRVVPRLELFRASLGERPLSFAQERLWFLDRFEPGTSLYNIPAVLRFNGRLDISALAAAFGEVVRRHEVLRTALVESVARRPVQKVQSPSPWELPLADLSGLPEPLREAERRRWADEAGTRPFDLSRPPMLRTLLLRLAGEEHALALAFHHVAADGWSIGIFLRELAALYGAFSSRRPSPLPELPLQYADFAAWQRDWLRGAVLEEQIGWWRTALAGAPEALDLPADRQRPAVLSHRGRQSGVRLPAGLSAELAALARRLGATPFMVLLAAFETLLGRICGQEDITVGSPIANRNRLEAEVLIGFFVNTLALRLDLSGDPSFEDIVRRCREVTLGAYAHQDVPFEKLVEELVPARDPSRTPLFQVLFALQNTPMGALELPGLRIEAQRVDTGTAKFDLSLLLDEAADGFSGFVEYATDLFDASTVERLMGHFETLLAGLANDPRTPVWDLPLLTEGEREQVVTSFNRTELEHPRDPLLHELVLAQAARTPDAVALVWGTERLTYREIAERSARMAAWLRAAGVELEVPVGVCLDRTPALLVSLLAVMRAGGFYVPLDPNYPKERLAAILEDSGAPVLVTEERCLPLLPDTGARIVRADRLDDGEGVPLSTPDATGDVRALRLAYTIYTSGSTGRPKGVAIAHRSAVALAYWAREVFTPADFAGVLGSTSVCFDMSVFELFVTLAWGGTVILAENALELPDLEARNEVTLINTVPSAMSELVRLGAVPPSVRTVILGGEALRGSLARRVQALGARLLNGYGPSEDTTFTTCSPVSDTGEPTIGRPLANTRIYVLDRKLRPMPLGVPGELYISGEGVTRGYLGRPDMTAEKYLPDPFRPGGARMYRVGDLGRWRPDGELEYLGRIDHQVKIRGFRIELGDVEAALLAHPAVGEAVVVTREPVPGDVRLTAFVVARSGPGGTGAPPLTDLREHVKARLPEYMVPWAIVPLAEMPLLPNGKVNRRALTRMELELGSEGARQAGDSDRARTPVEELIAGLWRDVLGLPEGVEVGIHQSFFELGGHSLLATQLVSRLREALGVELPLRRFFENPTVAGLAGLLPALGGTEAPPIRPVPRWGEMPLSFAQERLWFIDRFDPGSTMYNIPAAARLSGPLSVSALAAAIGEIVLRHEVLRIGFAEAEGRPVQALAPWEPLVLPVADLAALPEPLRDAELARVLAEDFVRPFDLGCPPMLRPSLVRLSDAEHVLLLDFHHIASDGWSAGVFLRELTPLYQAATTGRPSPLPPLEVQYADFAHWQREWMRGDVLLRHLDYWGRALAGAPPVLDLATDRPRAEVRDRRSAERRFQLPAPLVAELTRLGQAEGATLFSVLTAALQALLSRLAGQEDLVVGSPIANRNRLETEPLIGFFVNVLALRLDLAGDPVFLELLHRARETALGAYAHQDLPFEKLVELLGTARDLDSTPIFQVLIALQTNLWSGPRLGEIRMETEPVPSREAKFLLNVALLPEAGGGLAGVLEYRAGLFDPATMDRFAVRFTALLEAVAADPALTLSTLPLLASEEEIQLVTEWGRALPEPVRVLDGHLRPVPPGVVGNLVLEELDGGLRPTGERARWLSTGELEVLAHAAPEESLGSERGRAARAAPRTAVEELLAGIWMELLGVESVGLHDDFFALGGHSLLATRLLSQVRSTLGVSLPVRRLFEASTLEAQAAAVEAARTGVRAAQLPPILPLDLEGPLPLSFAQQRLWFLEQFDPGNPTYNIPAAVRLTGPLDVVALERALGGVLARHHSLRSRFLAVEGEPTVVIEPGVELPLSVEDAPDEARVLALAREEALRPFGLATPPLVRARLLRLAPTEHVLLLTMHHIVSDGWSMGILVREVADLYDGRELPELPIQYTDFAAWQRGWMEGEALAGEIAWWQERLAGAPAVLELPTDRPRPLLKTSRGGLRRAVLPAALVARLREIGRRSGGTLFMTLLAGLASLLHRYTRQDEVLVGSPIANRNRAEIEPLIGFFVNTLVLRADVSGSPSFGGLLARVRDAAMAAYDHQDLPFEKVVEAVRPDRDLARSPLFQVAFALQNLPIPELRLGDLILGPVPTGGDTVKFDWDIAMEEVGDEIQVRWAYNADLFDPATVERALVQLRNLLETAVAIPDERVSELPLLSAAERHALDAEWIVPDTYPGEDRVHERIAAQAARRPEAVALLLDGDALTYGELDQRANRLANRLGRLGIGPESLVGICLDRSFDLVVGLLAVLKAGAAYLPLDPNYPRERLKLMLRDSGVPVLVARQALLAEVLDGEVFHGEDLRTVSVDADRAAIDAESAEAPTVRVDPDHPAYVIYTSGSTGVPKGVVVSHRAMSNRLGWAAVYDVGEDDVVLQKTSVSFDVSVFEVFGPLMVGAREVLVRAEAQRDVDGLLRLIGGHGVTIASFPPSLLYVLMERDGFDAACRTLRTLVTGGEVVPADLPDRLLARLSPEARLLNRYGPTEATVSVTSWTCRHGLPERVLPIGRAIAGAGVYVLDAAMNPVPVGVPGEILLGGPSLARGYLGRPGQTAERFVPHPFSGDRGGPGERLYRTGDLARFRPDGALEFVGRVDGQVKIRGFRVELGEVEAVLARHPGVREVAVIDREESAAGAGTATRILVAYYVPDAEQAVEGNALRELARAELPAHMVPSAFVRLERLPLGPTGKVDRRSLPAPSVPSAPSAAPESSPRTGLEERIAAIWSEVLEVERVSLTESFFDLGGHSLLMARVHGRLEKELGRKISMVELFQFPTVSTLAAHLGGEARSLATVRRRRVSPESSKIAIIGMAGRFPRAADADQLWRNLCSGVEAISSFSDEELLAQGIDPALLADPRYVKAAGVLDGADLFDADFFGFNPREAELTDPQQRVFLECAWEALESAGYASGSPSPVGVYAGASFSGYLGHLAAQGALADGGNPLMGNDKDFLATRVSYKLNLRGPSLTVQTACSTSLVAVHLACQALLTGECGMALAGGVSIAVPLKGGYVYREGAIHSPDGRCRAFDAEAAGTPRGAGAGVVVLKRLEDALADGDTVHAVILGSAVNNDGSGKVGFTAPSVDGQAAVIAEAQAAAGIEPATIGYVEAHGTGTRRGDPIELAALSQAFQASGPTAEGARCAVVSSKPNIGHLDAAAGVASLIKVAFAVREGLVPPTLNFERLNPDVELEGTPFFINTELSPWPVEGGPRRAGVSSFGIGGTNAHLILEEPPVLALAASSQPWQLLLLSARTEAALESATERLARYLEDHPETDLADIAYTLRVGRRAFTHRRFVVCRDTADAIEALRDPRRIVSGLADPTPGTAGIPAGLSLDLPEHLDALARHWLTGGQPDWDGVQTGESRRRIPLPTYPFERRRYWVDAAVKPTALERRPDPADWTYVPSWKRTPPPMPGEAHGMRRRGLVFLDAEGLGVALAARLEEQGWSIETVSRGDDMSARLAELVSGGWQPQSIVHLWQDFESLSRLAQLLALAKSREPVDVTVVTDGVHDVVGGETHRADTPDRARLLGPCRAIPGCRWVDVEPGNGAADLLAAELLAVLPDLLVAHRGGHRWVRTYEPVRLARRLEAPVTMVRTEEGRQAVLDALSGATAGVIVLSSSLAELVGGDPEEVSMGAFAGALAEQRAGQPGRPRVLAVDWDPDVRSEEAAELLPRLLASGLSRAVVSMRDLGALLQAGGRAETGAAKSRSFHPRPNLSTPYVAPHSELETQVAGLWRELLGVESVGVDDNFFESGGHSLLATQLISQVRDRFGVDVKFARFFDTPTVAGLAAIIVERQAAAMEEAALAELLAEIQGLSAEDLQDQLAAEKQSHLEDGSS